jgi:hypothetical protein
MDETSLSNSAGLWLGWIGIILGVIGFFWLPIWMSIGAILLGIIGLFSPQKVLNWIAIILGVVVLLIALL